MTEWRCARGHEVSSDTGKLPHGCPACDHDLQRVDSGDEVPEDVREFAEEHGLDPETVMQRRAES